MRYCLGKMEYIWNCNYIAWYWLRHLDHCYLVRVLCILKYIVWCKCTYPTSWVVSGFTEPRINRIGQSVTIRIKGSPAKLVTSGKYTITRRWSGQKACNMYHVQTLFLCPSYYNVMRSSHIGVFPCALVLQTFKVYNHPQWPAKYIMHFCTKQLCSMNSLSTPIEQGAS